MPTSPLNVYRPVPSLPKGLVRAFPLGCQKAWSGWCSTSPWSSTYFRGCVCVCAHRWDCRAPQALVKATQQNYLAAGLKQTKRKYFFMQSILISRNLLLQDLVKVASIERSIRVWARVQRTDLFVSITCDGLNVIFSLGCFSAA